MAETSDETTRAELRITAEEARQIASLLRYAVSLNTTAGLVSPTQRRLATSTYRAVELAALVLEGKTLDTAVEESNRRWTGSLEEDHNRALELLMAQRDTLEQAMSNHLAPEQASEYLEVSKTEFLELLRPNFTNRENTERPDG